MRLIDADKADVNFINTYYSDHCRTDDVQEWLDEQPTIDAKPVKHGEWIKKYDYCDDEYWVCSACNVDFYFEFPPTECPLKYCPNCGAKMDGGKTDG